MSKLSIAFYGYTINALVEEMTLACLQSFRPHTDEIVFSEDGGIESPAIRALCDRYIYHDNVGISRNVNIGWEAATGDFVINSQTDTEYVRGDLRDLCIPDKITNPAVVDRAGERVISGFNGDQHGEFFCVPRALKEKYGMFDERLRDFMHDYLYFNTVVPVYQVVDTVVIRHLGHGTISKMKEYDERKISEDDYAKYISIIGKKNLEENGYMPLTFTQETLIRELLLYQQALLSEGRDDAARAVTYFNNRLYGICPVKDRIMPARTKISFLDSE